VPWQTRSLVEQREAFVQSAESDKQNFSSVCRKFGISRVTGYRWLARYRKSGRVGASLEDESRRPHSTYPIRDQVRQAIIQLRAVGGWGAKKIAAVLKAEGTSIGRTTVNRILKKHGLIQPEDSQAVTWIHEIFVADDPPSAISADPAGTNIPIGLAQRVRNGCLRDRKKAMAVIARVKGIPVHTVTECRQITRNTVNRYTFRYISGGLAALFAPRPSKINDAAHQSAVFAVLHSPPAASGINRTSWQMKGLKRALRDKGHLLSQSRIRRIIKAAGYKWRRARVVLTSNDPKYETKLNAVKRILANLTSNQAFFSIDEYGPFAIKRKPGRRLVAPGVEYTVPQWQNSKGWMIITAALELSRNQVTHFYSTKKNTEEMIKMADVLRIRYAQCSRIYLSWDAASWHISKRLLAHVEQVNSRAKNGLSPAPQIELAPLPAGAQFLNVIESIFSGMSRAIIHNSDYPSLGAAKAAIDRYFGERNSHFAENPKRPGS
jgi:transposase